MNLTSQTIYHVPDVKATLTSITLSGFDRNNQTKQYVLSDRSVAFVGSPGCGKTTQIFKVLNQLTRNPEGVTVVLDIKREYVKDCKTGDAVLSLYDIEGIPAGCQARWSLMREAYLDSRPEVVLKEIAGMVYRNAIEHSENKAFPEAAMLLFYALLLHIFRNSHGQLPSNKELIKRILAIKQEEFMETITRDQELAPVRAFLPDKPNVTSFGVMMEKQAVLLETFLLDSNFCHDDSNFSIREFIHEGKGQTLYLVFDTESRKSSQTIVRLLLDIAMKEALSGENITDTDRTRYNFVLDEYAYLPSGLEYLEMAKDVGRSKGIRIYAGFQNFSQLKKLYDGKVESAMNDIAGYGDIVVFKPHDQATREMVLSRAGTELAEVTSIDLLCNVHTECREMPVVPPEDLNALDCGEAVVLPNVGRPFWFRFME